MGSLITALGSSPLTRLRLAFVALGVLLLAPLGALMASANQRLEEQRRLRHEVVGERIFDELERELTDLLRRETRRPSSAYDQYTSPDAWAPFIVGYFTADPEGARAVSTARPDAARTKELHRVLPIWHASYYPAQPAATPSPKPAVLDGRQEEKKLPQYSEAQGIVPAPHSGSVEGAKPSAPAKKAQKTSPEVLNQLNRARDSRVKVAPAAPRDPMEDYSVGY